MKAWQYVVIGLLAGLLIAVIWGVLANRRTIAPTTNSDGNLNVTTSNSATGNTNTQDEILTDTSFFSTNDLPDRDPVFNFSASLPNDWAVETVQGSHAINLYDPAANSDTTLEQSQIFVKYFQASDFETLTTVDVLSRTETTVNNRPAVTYTIRKKSGVADFADQPSWRNVEHEVTDIRSTDGSPTIFYVFAKNPDLSEATFMAFLKTVQFTSVKTSDVIFPMIGFTDRITKKTFGLYITPSTSPVQPERFTGYHAGVDAETTAVEADQDVPVFAIADGTVLLAKTASGYGGVMMIKHTIGQETVTALYGHLRLSSIRKSAGQSVSKAEQIAVLGTGSSAETDGERKHLHFSLQPGSSTNLRGYVSSSDQLDGWLNPLDWLAQHQALDPTA